MCLPTHMGLRNIAFSCHLVAQLGYQLPKLTVNHVRHACVPPNKLSPGKEIWWSGI